MRTLLVTGGAGFIGSHFVERAVREGDQVVVLDCLTYAGHRENLAHVKGALELIEGNICDGRLVLDLLQQHQVDELVNFAAESHVDRSISEPSGFINTNIVGTFTLLNAALQHFQKKPTFRYLQVSTDEVFGSLGATGKFHEESPITPNSPYSASKAAADHLVRAWHHTYGLPVVTTHCSNNYGPRQYPEKLIPHMIACALRDKPLPVYGDGGNVRDWIHVEDHVEGIFLALRQGRLGECYCFGGNAERNNLDLVKLICQTLDRLRPRSDGKPHASAITYVTDRLGHDRRYAIDDTHAQKELGFKRRHEVEAGMASTVEWYVAHQAWCETVLGHREVVAGLSREGAKVL
ncbi:MAG TPA: dTDP-glucose 4,6-dehydratase [Candidatus Xenobia bacterium]|jgi:dTDP-glucose 4,6-dehydratase